MRRGVAAEGFSSGASLRDLFSSGLALPPRALSVAFPLVGLLAGFPLAALAGAFPPVVLAGAFPFALGFVERLGAFSFLPQAMWRFFLSNEFG
jgi:hypothetical protein